MGCSFWAWGHRSLSVWKHWQFKQMNDCLVRLDSDVAFGWLSGKFARIGCMFWVLVRRVFLVELTIQANQQLHQCLDKVPIAKCGGPCDAGNGEFHFATVKSRVKREILLLIQCSSWRRSRRELPAGESTPLPGVEALTVPVAACPLHNCRMLAPRILSKFLMHDLVAPASSVTSLGSVIRPA